MAGTSLGPFIPREKSPLGPEDAVRLNVGTDIKIPAVGASVAIKETR